MSKLLAEISEACRQLGMTSTRFGREAVGDPCFVYALEKGRQPSSRTVARVRAYIEGRPLAPPPRRKQGVADWSAIGITSDEIRQRKAMARGSARLLAAIRLARGEA